MATPREARPELRVGATGVTGLELFFDLVFVFALTQVIVLMADDTSAVGLFRGVLVLTVLWSCWIGYSWLHDVGEAERGAVRVAMFAATGAVFVAAVTVSESFDDMPGGLSGPVVFAACYLVVRALHLVVLRLVGADDPALRRQVARCVPPMAIGTVLLLAAAQTTGALQTWLWVAAVVGDLLGTALAGAGRRLASAGHLAQRHGLLVVVTLGGSLVATGIGIAQKPVSWPVVAASVLALIVSAALWRVCSGGGAVAGIRVPGHAIPYLAMIIGIVVMSLGVRRSLGHVAGDADYSLADPLRGLPLVALFGGAALFLLAHAGLTRLVAGRPAWERAAVAGVLVALIPPASMLPAIWSLALLAAVLVALVGHLARHDAAERHETGQAAGH